MEEKRYGLMRTKTEEQYLNDALRLFKSMGSFSASGRVSVGEEGNTPKVLNEIIASYTNKSDIEALEEAYERLYLKQGTLESIKENNYKNVDLEWTDQLKGNFEGIGRLLEDWSNKKDTNLSILEIDLANEGLEFSSDGKTETPLYSRPFKTYEKFKKELPSVDPRITEYQEYLDNLPDDDPYKNNFMNQPAEGLTGEDIINQYLEDDPSGASLNEAYENKQLPESAMFIMSILKNEAVDSELPTDADEKPLDFAPRLNEGDKDGDGIPDSIDVDGGSGSGVDLDSAVDNTTTDSDTDTSEDDKGVTTNYLESLGSFSKAITDTLGIVEQVRSQINNQDDLILAALGKDAYMKSMEQVNPTDLPGLSIMYKEHLNQLDQLSKQGFSVEEAQKARAEIDAAYGKGIENAVRGTAGDRAKFLAMSGVLDSQRQSALLDFAAKDAQLQRQNQANFTKALSFAEDYNLNKSKAERSQDLALELANKKGASDFAAKVFQTLEQRNADRRMQPIVNQYKRMIANMGTTPFQIQNPASVYGVTQTNQYTGQ